MIAPSSPGQAFDAIFEAARIAVTYRTPVIFLSDLFLANSSEPWKLPDADDLPAIDPNFWTTAPAEGEKFLPYSRDDRLARPWASRARRASQHRIGGLEKQDGTGGISYDGANHQRMTDLRAAKVAGRRRARPRGRRGRRTPTC